MVSGQDGAEPEIARPGCKRPVAEDAGLFLDRTRRRNVPLDRERRVRDAELFAQPRDHVRFDAAFRAQAVIDSRRLDFAGPRGRSEQQQRKAVRTARYGEPEPRSGRDQCVEIGPKTFDERVVGDHI